MKKQAYTVFAMIVLVGSMAVAAKAQTSGRAQLIANIPFQFNVGNKTLPAGEYVISHVNPTVEPGVLAFRSVDGSSRALIQMNSAQGKAQESAKLIFRRYGNQYFFAEAWVDGDNTGFQAPKSRAERATAHEFAAIKMATESVSLSSRR